VFTPAFVRAFHFKGEKSLASFWPKQHASRLGTVQAINYTGSQSAQTTNAFGASTQQVRIASPIAG
jgi:hypothetical protein